MKKQRNRVKLFIIDFLLLNLSVFMVYMLKIRRFVSEEVFSSFNVTVFVVIIISLNFIWFLLFLIFYRKLSFIDKLEEYSTIFKGIFLGIILIYAISFFIKPSAAAISWRMLGLYWLLTYTFVMAGKWFVHLFQIKLYLRTDIIKNALIIGTSEKAKDISETIENFPFLNYNILSIINDDEKSQKYFENLKILDNLMDEHEIEEVIIALDKSDELLIETLYDHLRKKKIKVSFRSDLYKLASGLAKIISVPGLPLINLNPVILNNEQKVIKRAIDIILSMLILIISFPLCFFIALSTKITSKGTIFFKQKRMKNPKEEYKMIKFRTMVMNAEKETGPIWADKEDKRVTGIGKILRKFWLDEIPQFINVLKGEMSIVGPRPERLHFVEILEKEIPFYRRRFFVKPGITGWAQVKHKYDESVEDVHKKITFDFYYIQNFSLWLDFKITFLTVYMMLFGKGH